MNITLRGNTWYLVKMYKGQRFFRSTGVVGKRNEAAARLRAAQMWEEIQAGIVVTATGLTRMSLSEAADAILEDQWASFSTGKLQHDRIIELAENLGDPGLHEIGPQWIMKAKKYLLEVKGVSEATVNRYMSHVRRLMRVAATEWNVDCTPPFITAYRESTGRERLCSEDEEAQIIEYLSSTEWTGRRAFFAHFADLTALLLDTGLRISEALALEYGSNIDLNRGEVTVFAAVAKNRKAKTIPMTDRVREILTRRASTGGRPFPVTLDQAENVMQHLREALQIPGPDFCWHTMRHTCATRLLAAGVDLYVVSKVLGHSSIKVTERYAHMQTDRLHDAIGKLNGRNNHE